MSIQKNTLINVVGAVVPMVVMLVTVPLYLKLLGEARYGVLALVWLVLGYFSFLEMGLGKATANHIAKAHNGLAAERSEIFWTALLVNAAMGAVGAGFLWLAGDFLITSVLKMPEDFRQETAAALPWMIATLPLALVSSVLNGALEGRSRFFLVNVLQVASNTVFQIAPLVVASSFSPSLEFVIPAAVLSRAFMNIPFLVSCARAVPLSIIPVVTIARAKSLFSYGGWVALSGILGPLMESLDRLIIGIVLGAKTVAYYSIAYQIATKIRVLPASFSRALFPQFSADSSSDTTLPVDSLLALLGIMTPVVIFAILLVGPFLHLWVGFTVASNAKPIAQILLIGIWANSLAYVPYTYLQGTGKPDAIAKLHMIELIPLLVAFYFGIVMWGDVGAAIVWTVRAVINTLILCSLARVNRNIANRLVVPIIMLMLVLLIAFLDGNSWVMLVASTCLSGWVAMWFLTTPIGVRLIYVKSSLRRRTNSDNSIGG
jgi:O-antigen/teichoic acid export membrane protein